MAVTITRTAWTDDDGSGQTGSVINNAAKTSIYDQIDAALALLLPLAGGTLTGALTVSVTGSVFASGALQFPNAITVSASTHASSRRAGIVLGSGLVGQDYDGNGTLDVFLIESSTKGIRIGAGTGSVTLTNNASVLTAGVSVLLNGAAASSPALELQQAGVSKGFLVYSNASSILRLMNTSSVGLGINTDGDVVFDKFMCGSVTAGITASTTQTQGQGALTAQINEISVCANANDTVTLPAAVAGREVTVINNGAQTLKIFPASGDDLGAGVNASATLATATNRVYQAFNSTNWEIV